MSSNVVILGDIRMILSNIAQYGISKKNRYYEKVYTENPLKWTYKYRAIGESRYDEIKGFRDCRTFAQLFSEEKGYYCNAKIYTTEDDAVRREEQCLFITTFQGEQYVFWESDVDFDIHKKREEIDVMFGCVQQRDV